MIETLFYLKAFGCQMNVYDSVRISHLLLQAGMKETTNETEANVIILNTCYIREKASEKIFSELGRLYKLYLRQKKPIPIFVVIGCVAKAEGTNIFKRAPFVSIILSSQKYHLLPELLEQVLNRENKKKIPHIINTELSGLEKFDCLPKVKASDKVAFVQIQEGCDKYCTYCVVPNTRGREISRSENDVIEEVKHLANLGAIEINLLGQNVDSYNGVCESGEKSNLANLIKQIAKIDNIKRIRYTTSYPSDFSDDMIQVHKEETKLCKLIYLPIQSGSDEILHKMNRRYTTEQYLKLIEKLKKANEQIQISSDFIVGFPGETDEDFERTLDIVKKVKFIQCYAFKYSRRPNTPAAKMPNQIDDKIKEQRLLKLQLLLRKIQDDFNKTCIGKVIQILLTDKSKINNNMLIGKSEYLQPVIVKANTDLIGQIINVKVTDASYANLKGEIIL